MREHPLDRISKHEGYYDPLNSRVYCPKCVPAAVTRYATWIMAGDEWLDWLPETCHGCGYRIDVVVVETPPEYLKLVEGLRQ